MSLIGRALARLAHGIGGQMMLELPDDLRPTFIGELIKGANEEVATDPVFALFVYGKRQDVASIHPRVDFRELAMYRQGSHLAVAFASDNRGMSTYSSVYPLLLSNGFPSANAASGGAGVAALEEFSACLAEVLIKNVGTQGLPRVEFQKATRSILEFLAAAYEVAGNGQSSFAADWWLHVQQWVDSLALMPNAPSEPTGIARLYGCAGLPVPSRGFALSVKPKDYVKVLQDRWSSPAAIMTEIARLEGIAPATEAAKSLARVDWEQSHTTMTLRTDSVVALVAAANGGDAIDRISGWGRLDEALFKESFVEAKGKLGVRRQGVELPLPWKGALPVLVAKVDELKGGAGSNLLIGGVELVIPCKPGALDLSRHHDAHSLISLVQVSGIRGCAASFEAESAELRPEGLLLNGTLALTPSKKAPNLVWIEASASGQAAQLVADRCSSSFTVLRPDEVALWAKPQGRSAKASLRGPIICSREDVAASVELPELGAYDLAVAWGEAAGFDGRRAVVCATPFSLDWEGMEETGAKTSVEITEGVDLVSSGQVIFRIDLFSSDERPLSPIVAASHGLHPDSSSLVEENFLSYLEGRIGDCLVELKAGHALGCFLATSSRHKNEFIASGNGVFHTSDLSGRTGNDLHPGFPSHQLLAHPRYVELLKAYESLGIPRAIADREKEDASAGLTISRMSLDFISKDAMDEILDAYRRLIEATLDLSPSDRFWARNPFSVVIYGEGSGFQSAQAAMLSPLHPLRLAWAWGLQVGLREAHDDGVRPAESLALLDGTNFPSAVVFSDQFGSSTALMPVPIDPRPNDLYLGWHASISIVGRQASIPEWVAGHRFPVDGLSTLSASSVSAAIDDFLRVSPHVQSLQIDLAATHPSRRSTSIDDGVIAKIRELAFGSSGLDGVAGVRVTDSESRLGPIPRLSCIDDAIATARPGFNVQWVSAPLGQSSSSHVTFLEGNAALLALESTAAKGRGWIPSLPLRRTPIRSRHTSFTSLDYSLADPDASSSSFAKALYSYESATNCSHVLKIVPNPVGVAGRPGWLVAGDFGVDPQTISRAARDQSNSNYILWDWRPATTIKAVQETSSRAQPYFVLASVPPALNSAIHTRLKQLNSQLLPEEVDARARLLISTLAERAIGLNTLLSIGHHQATGALGFFFALRSIGTWMDSAPAGEIRLVIPVDAVDPFLRASIVNAGDGSRKRADLLAVRAFFGATERPFVVLVPVEIKHYGLGNGEKEEAFPLAGEPRLSEHADQLASYQKQLQTLCDVYRGAAGSQASVLGQRLAAVLDAAIQLASGNPDAAASLLASVASGHADVELGKGVLLWYQARASGVDGSKASWDEISGALATRRNDVRVDPAAFDDCFWSGQDGLAHVVVRNALDDASSTPYLSRIIEAEGVNATLSKQDGLQSHEVESLQDSSSGHNSIDESNKAAVILGSVQPDALGKKVGREVSGAESPPSQSVPNLHRKKMEVAELERRYGALLAALSEFNVKVERPRGEVPYQEGPAFIEYAVFPAYGVSVNKIESQLENLKLRLRLSSDAEIGCSTHRGNVLLTVPKADSERYFVDALDLWSRWVRPMAGFKVPIGEDASGNIVELDFSNSNSPHLLIAGVTGSGKSEALLTILHGAVRYYSKDELRLRLIDPKQTELNTLASLPHTDGRIGWTADEAIVLLDEAVEEMERRYEIFRLQGIRNISEYKSSDSPLPRWIVVLDEYADLVSDDDERKSIEKLLQRLSQKARAAGIHVIVSTQKPVVKVINTVVKGNLPGKIALRVNTAMESRVVLDEPGAEKLAGKGDAIVLVGNGRERIQFARYAV